MLEAERAKILELRRTGTHAHEVLDQVLVQLDVEESILDSVLDDGVPGTDASPDVAPVGTGDCEDLRAAPDRTEPADLQCLDCIAEGTEPVHLRMCLECGRTGCCDSSPGLHASRHARESGHPVVRSVEPGEAWKWCYTHQLLG